MKKPWNILIFPGGMENGLEIHKALKYCKEVRLFSASSPVMNHAFYVYKNNHIVRDIREDGWVDDLNAVIAAQDIDLVYPANSLVIDHLAAMQNSIRARILLPDADVLRVTRSKKATLRELADVVPVPRVYGSAQEIDGYPIFVKPDKGYGAQGAYVVETPEQAGKIDFASFVAQELLPGREYTIDCFSDARGKLLFSGARERSRVRMATSMHAEPVAAELEEKLRGYAERILGRIPITGAWFFQMKEDKDSELRLLEIDVRIAGTMCFNRARGVNFPMLSILQAMGVPVSTMVNAAPLSLDRCLKNRYVLDYEYDTVYVDLDDTIVVHEQLNLEVIQFLYQCVNRQKRIALLTKYNGDDLLAYLKKWRISEIFDEVLHMGEHQRKSDHMKDRRSIYIDDSFSQRLEVHNALGIPTFDCSMVEGLLDERI